MTPAANVGPLVVATPVAGGAQGQVWLQGAQVVFQQHHQQQRTHSILNTPNTQHTPSQSQSTSLGTARFFVSSLEVAMPILEACTFKSAWVSRRKKASHSRRCVACMFLHVPFVDRKRCVHVALWEGQASVQLCVEGKTDQVLPSLGWLKFEDFRCQVRKQA